MTKNTKSERSDDHPLENALADALDHRLATAPLDRLRARLREAKKRAAEGAEKHEKSE